MNAIIGVKTGNVSYQKLIKITVFFGLLGENR